MDHTAPPPTTTPLRQARRARRTALRALALLAAALVGFVAQRPLGRHGTRPHAYLGTINGIVFLTVLALPLAALTVALLTRRHTAAGTAPTRARRAALAEVGIVYGTLPWVWMTMLPGPHAGPHAPTQISLVPLRDLVATVGAGSGSAIVQVGGNLLVLAALGFFGPVRFATLASLGRVAALAAACSTTIEILQYVLQLDRVSSIDDVLVNTTGAVLAALASRRWWHSPAPGPATATATA
ncbi:VanZ family protein [Kitasatospora sp. NPDC058965]|uniref:VanZ family protein n=1 Tax=Kitasatospora sp. NPDC058965 TaxID=3346682 RepID=UPI00368F098A